MDGEVFAVADPAGALLASGPFGAGPLSDRVASSPSFSADRDHSGCRIPFIQGHHHAAGTRSSRDETVA